tara:strand:+ start:253 stop:546 length:294 start_codon:yes stop_codon:yes gene_type:complete
LIKKKGQQKVRMIFWERRRCEEGQKGTFSNQLFEGRKKKEIKKEEDFWISLSVELVDVFPALDRRIRASFARDLCRNNAPLPPRRSFFERRQLVVVW